jgi:RNA recognition motif-containing protein
MVSKTLAKGKSHHLPPHAKESAISNKVFVGNLNFRTTEQQLSDALSAAGQVTHVHLGTDRETGRSRGFAFVEFSSEAEAAEAIRKFDGFEVDGRKLRVNTAEDRPRRTDGPRSFGAPRTDRPPYRSAGPSSGDPWTGFGAGGGDSTPGGGAGRPFKAKGSRRGLRARKRSLSF